MFILSSIPLLIKPNTTISTFSQASEANKEEQKASDVEASPAVVASVFGAWREVRKGHKFFLEKS